LRYKKEIRESYWEIPSQVEYESTDNYEIIETEEGKVVVNENAGLSFMVPEGWGVKETEEITWSGGINEYGIVLSTPEIELNPNSSWVPIPIQGCVINVYIKNDEQRFNYIETILRSGSISDNEEVVSISNYKALKNFYGESEELAQNLSSFFYILIEIPIKQKIYIFETYISTKDSKKCVDFFDNFIEKVSIEI